MADFPVEPLERLSVLDSSNTFRGRLTTSSYIGQFGGQVIEIDNELKDGFVDEEEEEVYDPDIMALFTTRVSNPTTLCVMSIDKAAAMEQRFRHFRVSQYCNVDFKAMEKSMLALNENRTVLKELVEEGDGKGKIPERCKVFYHIMAIAEGSTEPFDTSRGKKNPRASDLRKCDLLPGIELALRSMEVGETARFIVYSCMAFRELGVPPRVPQNAKILYVVEIVGKIDEEVLQSFMFMTSVERESLPFSTIHEEALNARKNGNVYYKGGKYQFAIQKWRFAINVLEDYPVVEEGEDNQRNELLWGLYSNLAQAYLKMNKPAQACNACKFGLRVASSDESFIHLYYRFAQAKLQLMDVDAALGHIKSGLDLDLGKGHEGLIALKSKALKEKRIRDNEYKNLCRKMFGTGTNNTKKDNPKQAEATPSAPKKSSKGYTASTLAKTQEKPATNEPDILYKSSSIDVEDGLLRH